MFALVVTAAGHSIHLVPLLDALRKWPDLLGSVLVWRAALERPAQRLRGLFWSDALGGYVELVAEGEDGHD